MSGLFPTVEMDPVNRLFLQCGEKTLAPGIVAGHTHPRKALTDFPAAYVGRDFEVVPILWTRNKQK